MPYSSLRADLITKQIYNIKRRTQERFPNRNLVNVCDELLEVSKQSKARAEWIAKPLYWVRLGLPLATVTFLLALAGIYYYFSGQIDENATLNFADFLEMSDALFNLIVLFLAFLFFLSTFEQRVKRTRTLKEIHQLRSLAHVIDMHQLTKDPEHSTNINSNRHTPSSPKDSMTMHEIVRYLDYCSEMLSMIGKLAALQVQNFDDEVAVAAVNEIENLTTGLSRKIWQKIMYVQSIDLDQGGTIFNVQMHDVELNQQTVLVESPPQIPEPTKDES